MCLGNKKGSVAEADGLSAVNTFITSRNARCNIVSIAVVQVHKFRAQNKLDLHSDPLNNSANDDRRLASSRKLHEAKRSWQLCSYCQ